MLVDVVCNVQRSPPEMIGEQLHGYLDHKNPPPSIVLLQGPRGRAVSYAHGPVRGGRARGSSTTRRLPKSPKRHAPFSL